MKRLVEAEALEGRQLQSTLGGATPDATPTHGASVRELRTLAHLTARLRRDNARFSHQFEKVIAESHVTEPQVADLKDVTRQVLEPVKDSAIQEGIRYVEGTVSKTALVDLGARLANDAWSADDAMSWAILHGWFTEDQWHNSLERGWIITSLTDMGVSQDSIDRYLTSLRDFAVSDGITRSAYEKRLLPRIDAVIADQGAILATGHSYPNSLDPFQSIAEHPQSFVHQRPETK